MRTRTGTILKGFAAALLLTLPAMTFAAAPPELNGVWEGKLAVDAKTSLAVQFTFTKTASGSYTAVLNSPDNPDLKNTAVSGVTWDGSSLKLQVPTLSGSYAGTLRNGKIGGQWSQPGSTLALELAPFQKPVVAASTVKALVGTWVGPLAVPGGPQNLTFQFKQAADGSLEGTFQGGLPIAASNIVFQNGELTVKIPQASIEYKAKLAGEQIAGRLKVANNPGFPPEGLALNLKRGEPPAPPKPVALKLNAEAFGALKGKWQGKMDVTNPQTGQKAQLAVIVRFESNDKGEYFGFMDSPSQNAKNIPVSEASLADGRLAAKVATVRGEFAGTLSGNTLAGEWSQPGLKTPLTLTR